MHKEESYLKKLMQEVPREKAPEGITQLIMQKITAKEVELMPLKHLRVWQTQAFYIMLAIVGTEAWLFWSLREWFTLATVETLLRDAYVQVCQYVATNGFAVLFWGIALIGIFIYLFVKDRIENAKYTPNIV